MSIFLTIAILGECFCFYMLFRNRCVGKFRLGILDDESLTLEERLKKYDSFPRYNEMMNRFWIWNFEKNFFKKEEDKDVS